MAIDPANVPEPDDAGGPGAPSQPTIPLTTPIRDSQGLLTYMGSDGRRYVVFGDPPEEGELTQGQA